MEFRPCIDIHNGQVKQIVGSSLVDQNDQAKENFVAAKGTMQRFTGKTGLREDILSCSIPLPVTIMRQQRARH